MGATLRLPWSIGAFVGALLVGVALGRQSTATIVFGKPGPVQQQSFRADVIPFRKTRDSGPP